MIRPPVKDPIGVVKEFDKFYKAMLKKKGVGAFVSSHEIAGKLQEEVTEFLSEVHDSGSDYDPDTRKLRMRCELMDIAVIALHGVASLDSDKVEID